MRAHQRIRGHISTHAPGRGRSPARPTTPQCWRYFYSRPRAGAIIKLFYNSVRVIDFYSRPRAGAIQANSRPDSKEDISTHAPGRGRSGGPQRKVPPELNFYSRPRAGAIRSASTSFASNIRFLLTPPGGGDLVARIAMMSPLYFYSRPRAGAIGNLPQNRYHVPRQTAERSLAFLWDPPRMIAKLPPKPRKAPESTALTFHEIMVGKGRR